MTERLGPSDQAAATLANVLALKAVAEHALGRERDAAWHWQMAQALDSAVVKRDLSAGGDFSAFLQNNLLINPLAVPGVRHPKNEPTIQAPTARKQRPPSYPKAALHFGVQGDLIVVVVVGADGLARHPYVFQPLPAATLTLAALEALKDWRFDPATLDGKPVAVPFSLTVHYKPRE